MKLKTFYDYVLESNKKLSNKILYDSKSGWYHQVGISSSCCLPIAMANLCVYLNMEVPSMDQEFVEDVAHCDNGAAIGREKLLKYFNLYDKVKQTSDKEKAVSEVCIFTMMHSKYNLHAVLNLPHSKSSDKTDIVNPILDNQIVKTFNKKDFLEYTLPDGNINNRYFILKY